MFDVVDIGDRCARRGRIGDRGEVAVRIVAERRRARRHVLVEPVHPVRANHIVGAAPGVGVVARRSADDLRGGIVGEVDDRSAAILADPGRPAEPVQIVGEEARVGMDDADAVAVEIVVIARRAGDPAHVAAARDELLEHIIGTPKRSKIVTVPDSPGDVLSPVNPGYISNNLGRQERRHVHEATANQAECPF